MPTRTARRARRPTGHGDAGLAAVELAVLTPFVIAVLLLVVGFGRVTQGRQLVDQAAAAAARAASLANTPGQAEADGREAATDTLTRAGVSCTGLGVMVDTARFHAGGDVSVQVRCTADLSGLALAGLPGAMTMTATAQAPLETFREISLGLTNSERLSATNPGVGVSA
jgi:Flp pilus assembly protein TadG